MGTREREKPAQGKTFCTAWWVHSQRVWDVLKAPFKGGRRTNAYIGYLLDDCNHASTKPMYGLFCPNLPKVDKKFKITQAMNVIYMQPTWPTCHFLPKSQQYAMCVWETLQLLWVVLKVGYVMLKLSIELYKLELLFDTRHDSKHQATAKLHIIMIDADLKGFHFEMAFII